MLGVIFEKESRNRIYGGRDSRQTVRKAQTLAIYDQVPSYQRINQREGVDSVVDLALIGSAGDIAAGLQRYLDAGATDLLLMPIESGRDAWHRVCDLAAGIPHPRGGLESGHDRS